MLRSVEGFYEIFAAEMIANQINEKVLTYAIATLSLGSACVGSRVIQMLAVVPMRLSVSVERPIQKDPHKMNMCSCSLMVD